MNNIIYRIAVCWSTKSWVNYIGEKDAVEDGIEHNEKRHMFINGNNSTCYRLLL